MGPRGSLAGDSTAGTAQPVGEAETGSAPGFLQRPRPPALPDLSLTCRRRAKDPQRVIRERLQQGAEAALARSRAPARALLSLSVTFWSLCLALPVNSVYALVCVLLPNVYLPSSLRLFTFRRWQERRGFVLISRQGTRADERLVDIVSCPDAVLSQSRPPDHRPGCCEMKTSRCP